MNPPNVLVECSIENIQDELCEPRMENKNDRSFVPPKYMYIKNLIPVVLDLYNVHYSSWSTIFRDAARPYNLLHHIDPTIPTPDVQSITSIDDDDTTLWRRQDAIVLSWIYATISPYLLYKLRGKKPSTAMNAWAFLRYMCHEYTTTVNKKRRRFIHHIDLDEDDQVVDDDRVDFISNLSDDLLVYVLFLVADMKTAARTSLLSKRWTHVWTQLKDLDFDDLETSKTLNCTDYARPEIDNFVDRVNCVIIANQAAYLDTFRIQFPLNSSYAADIHNWLKFAFGKEVRNLDLDFGARTYASIHYSNIFSNNPALVLNTTLTSFQLRSVTIKGPFLQWVLTNCLNLERLSLHRCKASADDDSASSKSHRKLVVSSLKLKHLEFFGSLKLLNFEVLCLSAPNLTSVIICEKELPVEYRSVPSLVDATFGGVCRYHIFQDLDTLSGFSSQLEKLSIPWQMEHSVPSQFPKFANVQQLEIESTYGHIDLIRSTSLIEACPLLQTFKLKMMCSCRTQRDVTRQISAPNNAQENAIRCHQHLKVVEYLGYHGCASATELAICLARHAPMLQRFIFDTRLPRYRESPLHPSDREIVRRTKRLAIRIQRMQYPLDVVVL
ncbi:FBD domain-containing protein [Heracleum sosnowskyi]|uniref:FBD domain-containing protein n=1 Tax=Heracleum sosnowskyi TaxID=360622 RepID=A0AAD8LW62_9APIA|nr:FBD domain-containing protein [Heracleum sosnowskyi]